MPVDDAHPHIANIGQMIEEMEIKMRNSLQEVYFGKTKVHFLFLFFSFIHIFFQEINFICNYTFIFFFFFFKKKKLGHCQ